jgi:uncharacterized integral membrane protein (TIGR00698 family)
MPKTIPWNKIVPRTERDLGTRNADLGLELERIITAIAPGLRQFQRIIPGLLLCGLVALAAIAMQVTEERLFGRAWLESLVIAILLGTVIRTAWTPSARWSPGISFSAKMLLEVAVLLLGAAVSTSTIMAIGPALLAGIMLVVVAAITISYGVGRILGLRQRVALLVACGNSICGNSAIAAVAPVIGADSADVTSAIAFTAVLGVIVVLALPLVIPLVGLTLTQYGVLAGLTIYAVPQVLAATAPIGAVAVQTGTLVKLVRVLMLGPVVLVLSLLANRLRNNTEKPASHLALGKRSTRRRPPLHQLVPWFIVGFLSLAALRSAGLVPHAALDPAATASSVLMIVAMAALGLGVNVRVVASAGARVTGAVTISLLLLGTISLGLIRVLGVS